MRLTKTLGFAGALVLSALVGGTFIGSTLATDETDTGNQTAAGGEYCDTFMDVFAGELDVSRDELVAAAHAAGNTTLDAAVEAGDVTEERAEALRERIAAYDGSGCGWFGKARAFHHGFGRGLTGGIVRGNVLEAAADTFGIESSELIGAARDAGSLEAFAEEMGTSYDEIQGAILAAVQADLDAAVAEGMSAERADAIEERVSTWLDEGGEVRGSRDGPGRSGGWHGRDAGEESGQ